MIIKCGVLLSAKCNIVVASVSISLDTAHVSIRNKSKAGIFNIVFIEILISKRPNSVIQRILIFC